MRDHLFVLVLLLAGCGTVVDERAFAAEYADPPGRVARLSFIRGAVSIAPAVSEEWGEALLNRPLTSGDRIWVDAGARAELDVGSATLSLDENTSFSFVNLGDDVMQMRLAAGVVMLHVRLFTANSTIAISTPNTTVTPLASGEYSIEAAESGALTIVKVHNGQVAVTGGVQQAFEVAANEQGVLRGAHELTAEFTSLDPRNEFENWAYERAARERPSVAARYVASEVIGYRELDGWGTWYNEPDYGHVWQPERVGADWAPYRYGRWVWVSPWGWTWIDDAPWGFAPSHYGRWTYLRQRWCWVPGPARIRPVYAPALVGWVGDPNYGFANVGWFPLAPREAYLPGYRASRRHYHDVNASNTLIVDNTTIDNVGRGGPIEYHNRNVPYALTVVPRDAFVSARPVGAHRARIDADELSAWPARAEAPAITPGRDSIVGVHASATPPAPHLDRSTTVNHGSTFVPRQPLGNRTPDGQMPAEHGAPPEPQGQPRQDVSPQPTLAAPPSPVVIEQQQWPRQYQGGIGARQADGQPPERTFDHGDHEGHADGVEPAYPQHPDVAADAYQRDPRSMDIIAPPSHSEAPVYPVAPERAQTDPLEQMQQRAPMETPRGHQGGVEDGDDNAQDQGGQAAEPPRNGFRAHPLE